MKREKWNVEMIENIQLKTSEFTPFYKRIIYWIFLALILILR